MINSPEAQFQYALKLPMQELTSIMQGKPSQISQSVAMMAMQKLKATKTAMQGQQAQQQLNKPSVKNQLVQESQMPESQGIGQLAAQNMNEVVHAAHGGIIGFSGEDKSDVPYDYSDYYGKRRKGDAGFNEVAPGMGVGEKLRSALGVDETPISRSDVSVGAKLRALMGVPVEEAYPSAPSPAAQNAMYTPRSTYGAHLGDMYDPQAVKASQPPSAPGPQAPRPAAPMRGAPTATSSIPGQRQPAYPGDMLEPQTPSQGIATLSPAPTADPRTRETFEELQRKFSSTTKPYMDEMTAAMKALTDSPEEKNARGEKRTGIMMMKAAQQLLTGGRSGAASRGAALGSVGDLAQEYTKEDDAAKRAQIGAKITMLGAQAHLAQGDNKSAMDMFQHAQNLEQKYAHLEATKAQHAAEIASKNKGHDIDRQKMEGEQAYRSAMIRITEPLNQAHAQYYRALGAAGGTKGQLTPKDLANFRDKATDNVRAALDKNPVLQAKANRDPALMQQLFETEFANLTQNRHSAPQPAPSIQLPDSAAAGRNVLE